MQSYRVVPCFSYKPSLLLVIRISENFAQRDVVTPVGMLVSKLQDEQLIDRMLILPTPAHFKQKMKEFKLISITHSA